MKIKQIQSRRYTSHKVSCHNVFNLCSLVVLALPDNAVANTSTFNCLKYPYKSSHILELHDFIYDDYNVRSFITYQLTKVDVRSI